MRNVMYIMCYGIYLKVQMLNFDDRKIAFLALQTRFERDSYKSRVALSLLI